MCAKVIQSYVLVAEKFVAEKDCKLGSWKVSTETVQKIEDSGLDKNVLIHKYCMTPLNQPRRLAPT
jgi:hypothetical protein